MKRLLLPLIGFIFSLGATAQHTELKKSQSGLIYSDTTISQLKLIVDSLNLQFKNNKKSIDYYSKYQSKAHILEIEKKYFEEAIEDMDRNISLFEFEMKYNPQMELNLTVVKFKNLNKNKSNSIRFSCTPYNRYIDMVFTNNLSKYEKPLKGKWLYQLRGSYRRETLTIFYIVDEFERLKIPSKYAKAIQYVDCIVDTNATIFFENCRNYYAIKLDSPLLNFLSYFHVKTNKPVWIIEPVWKQKEYNLYSIETEKWNKSRFGLFDSMLLYDQYFNELLLNAYRNALITRNSNDEFDEYVATYISAEDALFLKRSRILITGCYSESPDNDYVFDIELLAAKTLNWGVFIRSYLYNFNDGLIDYETKTGTYNSNKTNIKVLEALNVNITDLIIGMALWIDNESENHYGPKSFLGNVIQETIYQQEIELRLLEMIADNSLDNYNRILVYDLYRNYVSSFTDKHIKDVKLAILNTYVEKMPIHMANRLLIKK